MSRSRKESNKLERWSRSQELQSKKFKYRRQSRELDSNGTSDFVSLVLTTIPLEVFAEESLIFWLFSHYFFISLFKQDFLTQSEFLITFRNGKFLLKVLFSGSRKKFMTLAWIIYFR